jgi:hypothetical protein
MTRTTSDKIQPATDKSEHRNIFREPGIHYNQQFHHQKNSNEGRKLQTGYIMVIKHGHG